MLTLGSLFVGIGGWLLASKHAGVKPVWSSEIEKFPLAVTKHHFPEVKQLGDITQIKAEELEPVDIICAGSPCQDLSLAGKREGLKGERSGLFRIAVDIVHRLRRITGGRQPRFFVWENVPGAFSSNRGLDFRAVLEEIGQTDIPMPENNRWANAGLVQCPQCEIAWRVLDAQFWGVPQRRKRIFLVADFAESGRRAAKILFIDKGVSGDIEPGGKTGKETAGTIEKSVGNTSVHRGGTFDIRISSNGTQNWRAHCYETERSRSLDTHAPDPDTNHGGGAILEDVNLSTTGGQSAYENHAQDYRVKQVNVIPTIGTRPTTNPTLIMENIPEQNAYAIGNGQVHQLYMQDKCGTLNCMSDQIKVIQKIKEAKNDV